MKSNRRQLEAPPAEYRDVDVGQLRAVLERARAALSPEDYALLTGAVLVANFEICTWLNSQGAENYSPGNHGGRISFDDFDVIFTNAWHSSSDTSSGTPVYLGNPAGFIIEPKAEK